MPERQMYLTATPTNDGEALNQKRGTKPEVPKAGEEGNTDTTKEIRLDGFS